MEQYGNQQMKINALIKKARIGIANKEFTEAEMEIIIAAIDNLAAKIANPVA
jgi:hypothetical protein